jgi:transketolase
MTVALDWKELDQRAVDTARVLAMDAVERVGNGHPGTAMSLAPVAYLLFQRYLRHDPADPKWLGRDRFVLSNGHSSLTLYTQLFLSGTGLELSDLESFRTRGSHTPGHPEYGHTAGVETTTGPLGQGIANAVGMAMSRRYVRDLLDPAAPAGTSPFDHRVWVIAGDGCLEEGISSEASSLAGRQALDGLILVWDDNHISIEGDTALAFSETVVARYRAYGWHTIEVELAADGSVDVAALNVAYAEAITVTDRPVFIKVRTIIGWPAPHLQNTGKIHGSALGAAEVAATKTILGFDPEQSFVVAPEVLAHTRAVRERGAAVHRDWDAQLDAWRLAHPAAALLLDRLQSRSLPADLVLPTFQPGKSIATRRASGEVINAIANKLPEFWGGSADLGESNNTTIEGAPSFLPVGTGVTNSAPGGRVIHFGIREHAMGAALNGIALAGLTRPFGGTFLVFSDYMRGAVRLSALMQAPVTYVWTHDSIGLGEDGPTHQPVEHLAALRAIPGLAIVRPADANETSLAWRAILDRDRPTGLVLSRQNLPVLELGDAGRRGVARGGYVLADSPTEQIDVLLLATGSEVSLALAAQLALAATGIGARVVSLPCLEWFEEQDEPYRNSVIPPDVKARVSIEAGVAMPWYRLLGSTGKPVSLEHFGASATAEQLFADYGFTVENVVTSARASIAESR